MKVEVRAKKRVFDGFFKVDEAQLRFEHFDGTMSPIVTRLIFDRGDSVAAVVLDIDAKEVLLVEQFKYPSFEKGPGWIIETVAGMVDGAETAEDAIRREILEEMGCRVSHLEHIRTFYVSPGGSSERIVLFYAETCTADKIAAGGGLRKEGEDIRILRLPLERAWNLLSSPELADAKTIIALMWLKERQTSHL